MLRYRGNKKKGLMKFSIITINRNNAAGLQRTIESVVTQIDENFEYLVIDGASTDESVNVINKYSDKINYWISEPDGGIYNAMNKGILRARGEYCLFLNSGDWFVENILDILKEVEFDVDIVYGNVYVEFNNGLSTINKGCTNSDLSLYDFYTDTIRHQAAFVKTDLFKRYGNYKEEYNIVSDWLFFVEVIIFGSATYKHVDLMISHFEAHGIGGSLDADIERNEALRFLLPNKIIVDYDRFVESQKKCIELNIALNRFKNRFSKIDRIITRIKKLI